MFKILYFLQTLLSTTNLHLTASFSKTAIVSILVIFSFPTLFAMFCNVNTSLWVARGSEVHAITSPTQSPFSPAHGTKKP